MRRIIETMVRGIRQKDLIKRNRKIFSYVFKMEVWQRKILYEPYRSDSKMPVCIDRWAKNGVIATENTFISQETILGVEKTGTGPTEERSSVMGGRYTILPAVECERIQMQKG